MTGSVLDLLAGSGALRPGHTTLQGGRHSDGWVDKGPVMRDPGLLDEVAQQQAAAVRRAWPDVTLLVGLPACGAVLASFVARHLRLSVAYVQGSADLGDSKLTWHRMHRPAPGQRVVIVDDLIGTGQGVRAAAAFVRGQGHDVLGVSAWISRAEAGDLRTLTLLPCPYHTWSGDCCPDCSSGYPPDFMNIRE